MSTYIITYDLHKAGQNYDCLFEKLKAFQTRWHAQQSVWIVQTSWSAAQVRDYLSSCLDHNDKLLVAKLEGEAAWWGMSHNVTDWLKSVLDETV
ncbi:MAG: SinR family protein [Pseudomonadota bacterium]